MKNEMENIASPLTTPSQGPLFDVEPGWGNKLSGWFKLNFEKRVIPILAIAVLILGLSLYFKSRNNAITIVDTTSQNTAQPVNNDTIPSNKSLFSTSTFKIEAKRGQGITHLARSALSEYLSVSPVSNLNAERKVYIEDYLQNKTGDRFLEVGEEIGFSIDDIEKAIFKAQQLKPEEIKNLSKYVKGPRL